MSLSRILAAAALFAALFAATPALAATGPFTVAPDTAPRGTILVIDGGSCDPRGAAAQAALAARAGRAVGVVAQASACAAADAVMTLESPPALAFADDAQALGPNGEPNGFLARNRADGVYVWSMESYRRLSLPASRQVLGVFEGESQGSLIGTALERLSQQEDGYFLLIQADALDAGAIRALDAARAEGAAVFLPSLIHNTGLID